MSTRYSNATARYAGADVLGRGEEFGVDEIAGDYAAVIAHDDELLAVEGTYGELRAWLVGLVESLDTAHRANTPTLCPGTGSAHDWILLETGYARRWTSIEVDVDGNVSANAHDDAFDEEGEGGYHLTCQQCGKERETEGRVDFVL